MSERDWVRVVAEERCEECGLRAGTVRHDRVVALLRAEGPAWHQLVTELSRTPAVRGRPSPEVWSALEYAAHVRDVLGHFDRRLARVLAEDLPEFGWWDHEAAAVTEAYNEQDPARVVDELAANVTRFTDALAAVAPADRDRAGTRRGVERFTVTGLGRFALHESVHHRVDARRSAGGVGADARTGRA